MMPKPKPFVVRGPLPTPDEIAKWFKLSKQDKKIIDLFIDKTLLLPILNKLNKQELTILHNYIMYIVAEDDRRFLKMLEKAINKRGKNRK
jgi:hypothetical protein